MLVRSQTEVQHDVGYNVCVARGWESKSVEDQISARENEASVAASARLSPQQRDLKARREGLQLARKRTLDMIEATRGESFRAQLRLALAHLDAELEKL